MNFFIWYCLIYSTIFHLITTRIVPHYSCLQYARRNKHAICNYCVITVLCVCVCFRLVWPAAGGGGAGRSHGDGADLHRTEERRTTPGTVLLRNHQVSWILCFVLKYFTVIASLSVELEARCNILRFKIFFFSLTEPVNLFRCRLMGNLGCRLPAL